MAVRKADDMIENEKLQGTTARKGKYGSGFSRKGRKTNFGGDAYSIGATRQQRLVLTRFLRRDDHSEGRDGVSEALFLSSSHDDGAS